ncbi:MAG TPA: phosphate ABC transporter permease PstA [Egibacteraceae bacterium]|nr:phosphate ABC transporter permease PstA [Egibacteraceae bacterium]
MTTPVSLRRRASVGSRLAQGGFRTAMLVSLFLAIGTLVALLAQVTVNGWPRLNSQLFTAFPSSRPERAGAQSAIFGTIWVMGVVAFTCIPVGVSAAIYLEEYADRSRWYNRVIELNIQNLAAVPAIVYGILGLAFLVRGIPKLGPTVLAAGLTLSLLVLPVVIIASREAIRAVPSSLREGSLSLGATQWQTVSRQVVPAALPGIATGTILAMSRAIGEAAPLLLLGALTFVTFNPDGLDSPFTVMPVQIFNWISRPQDEFRVLAAAAIVVLLGLLLAMNAAAIWLRNHYRREW